jgi:hypothetical protein
VKDEDLLRSNEVTFKAVLQVLRVDKVIVDFFGNEHVTVYVLEVHEEVVFEQRKQVGVVVEFDVVEVVELDFLGLVLLDQFPFKII